jgi:hypothetical protein
MSDRFSLGRVVITRNALETLASESVHAALRRHRAGDWGDLCDADKRENERSLTAGFRLFSAYRDSSGTTFWIITEADRSATTVLLPEDY